MGSEPSHFLMKPAVKEVEESTYRSESNRVIILERRDFMRKLCLGLIIVGLATFLTSGIGSAQQKFRIGCADPLTGIFGRDGNLVKDAYTFWADLINSKGGIEVRGKRYPVELTFIDPIRTPAVIRVT